MWNIRFWHDFMSETNFHMLELFSHIFHMPFTCLPLVVTEVTRKGKKSETVCSFLSFVITLNFNVVMGSDLLSELKQWILNMFYLSCFWLVFKVIRHWVKTKQTSTRLEYYMILSLQCVSKTNPELRNDIVNFTPNFVGKLRSSRHSVNLVL